jgi:hypothetical protein
LWYKSGIIKWLCFFTIIGQQDKFLLQAAPVLDRHARNFNELVTFLVSAAHSMPTQKIVCDEKKLREALIESQQILEPLNHSLHEFAAPVCVYFFSFC